MHLSASLNFPHWDRDDSNYSSDSEDSYKDRDFGLNFKTPRILYQKWTLLGLHEIQVRLNFTAVFSINFFCKMADIPQTPFWKPCVIDLSSKVSNT